MDTRRELLRVLKGAEEVAEASLRPRTLAEYVGQRAVTDNLKVFIEAPRAGESP